MAEPYTVLHGGFHKTASTFLQKTLQRNKGKLRRHDIKYVPHREIRRAYTVPCQQNVAFEKGLKRKTLLSPEQLREQTRSFFEPILEEAPKRLILSDENLAGHCGHCVKPGQLYRYHAPFIGVFAREMPLTVKEIHLSVRNYADFFPAAYVEYLRSLKKSGSQFVSSKKMCTRVLQHMPSWNGVIDVVTRHFPEAKIIVWRFEDFVKRPDLKTQILQNLVGEGVDVSRFDQPKKGSRRPSTSGKAVRELEMLALVEGVDSVVALRQEIQEKYPRSDEHPAFDPWEPWERRHLTSLYKRDLDQLRTYEHIVIL